MKHQRINIKLAVGLFAAVAAVALSVQADAPAESSFEASLMDLSNATSGWGKVRIGKSVSGQLMKVGGMTMWRGIGTHAPSKIVVPLGEGALRVETRVGVDDASKSGSVVFRIWADDKVVAESPLMKGGDAAHKMKADLRGAKTCTLEVTDGGDGKDCDHADWIETRFWYEAGKYPANDVRNHSRQLGILTPQPGPAPRINGARVLGVRPGHPVLWRLPVTGERPMKLSAANLPEGLSFDPETQVLSGSVARPGEYSVSFAAETGAAARSPRCPSA